MTDLLPWEAPAVFDIDLTNQTHGGASVFTSESTYTTSAYNGQPPS